MKHRRITSTIRQSKHFREILDIYSKNKGKMTEGKIFKLIRDVDPGISRSAYYRWTKDQRDVAVTLENKAIEEVPAIRALEKIDEHALYGKAIKDAMLVYDTPELLAQVPVKDRVTAGLNASRLIQAEKELYLNQSNFKEAIDLKKEAQYAAYKPTTVIEFHNEGKDGPDNIRTGSTGDGVERSSDPVATRDDEQATP